LLTKISNKEEMVFGGRLSGGALEYREGNLALQCHPLWVLLLKEKNTLENS